MIANEQLIGFLIMQGKILLPSIVNLNMRSGMVFEPKDLATRTGLILPEGHSSFSAIETLRLYDVYRSMLKQRDAIHEGDVYTALMEALKSGLKRNGIRVNKKNLQATVPILLEAIEKAVTKAQERLVPDVQYQYIILDKNGSIFFIKEVLELENGILEPKCDIKMAISPINKYFAINSDSDIHRELIKTAFKLSDTHEGVLSILQRSSCFCNASWHDIADLQVLSQNLDYSLPDHYTTPVYRAILTQVDKHLKSKAHP